MSRSAKSSVKFAGGIALCILLIMAAGLWIASRTGGVAVTRAPLATAAAKLVDEAERDRAALRLATESGRLAGYEKIIGLYDAAEAIDARVSRLDERQRAFEGYLAALLTSAKGAGDPGRRAILFATARSLAGRMRATSHGVGQILELARQQVVNAPAEAGPLLELAARRGAELSPDEGDPVIASAVKLLAGLGPAHLDQAGLWAERLRTPKLQAIALQEVAAARLRVNDSPPPELARFKGLWLEGKNDPAAAALLDAAEALRVNNRYASAVAAALAVPLGTPDRDALLKAIALQDAAPEMQDLTAIAALGLTDLADRDDALFVLAERYLAQPQVSAAIDLTQSMTDRALQAVVFAHAAEVLSGLRLDQQALQVANQAQRIARGARMTAPRRDQYNLYLARTDFNLASWKAGRSKLAKVHDERMRSNAALAAAASASDRVNEAELRRLLSAVDDRSTRLLLIVRKRASGGKPQSALHLARTIHPGGARQLALAAVVQEFVAEGDRAAAHRLADEIGATRLPAAIDERADGMAAAAIAWAAVGREREAALIIPEFLSTRSSSDLALEQITRRYVASGNMAAAQSMRGWAQTDRQLDRAARTIATALSDLGRYTLAAEYTLNIVDPRVRVSVQRAIAIRSARNLDERRLLTKAATAIAPIDQRLAPILRTVGFDFYPLRGERFGEVMPQFPRFTEVQPEAVSKLIPASDPGNVHIVPMVYNAFSQKFLYNTIAYLSGVMERDLFAQNAQDTRYPVYVHLESGVFDVPTLHKKLLEAGRGDALVKSGRTYLLRLPILVSPGATLVIGGADLQSLHLEQQRGVIIVNAGSLYFQNVDVVGWDSAKAAPATIDYETRRTFRPFIVSWGGSKMSATNSVFSHLGFGGTTKGYGFSYSQGPKQFLRDRPGSLAPPKGDLIENSFDNLYFGFFSFESDDIRLIGNEYKNNIVYGIDPHDYSSRLQVAYNTVYGSGKKHGIIASRHVNNSYVVGNMSFRNHGSGVMMDRTSSGNIIFANRLWGNEGDGVAIFESPCNVIAANGIFGNGRDGVKIRNSWDVGIFGNNLAANRGSAVNLYVGSPAGVTGAPRDLKLDPYSMYSAAVAVGNQMRQTSRSAVFTSRGFGALGLQGNTIVASASNPVFSGELKSESGNLWRMQRDGVVVRSNCKPAKREQRCPFLANRMLSGGTENLPAAPGKTVQCVGVVDLDDEGEEAAALQSMAEADSAVGDAL